MYKTAAIVLVLIFLALGGYYFIYGKSMDVPNSGYINASSTTVSNKTGSVNTVQPTKNSPNDTTDSNVTATAVFRGSVIRKTDNQFISQFDIKVLKIESGYLPTTITLNTQNCHLENISGDVYLFESSYDSKTAEFKCTSARYSPPGQF